MTMAAVTAMPASGAGIALVTFGTPQITSMVSPVRPSITRSGMPVSHSPPAMP